MRRFDPSRSLLAGMEPTALLASLRQAQQILLLLGQGGQGRSYSYTQGDGTRSVEYNETNIKDLSAAIQLMQAQLGIVESPRRANRMTFSRR